jgi:hypothetical protein
MKNEEMKVVLEMSFTPRALYQPVLESIRRNPKLSLDRVRARLSETEAWFEMELTGDADAIDDFLHRHRARYFVREAVA